MYFLRKLFAAKEQVWKPYCDAIGGRYVEGSLWSGDRIEIAHHTHVIALVSERDLETGHHSTLLRVEADLIAGLMLGLLRNWPGQKGFNLMVSLFGLQRATVSGLTDDCVVLARDQQQAEAFFGDKRLQDLLLEQPQMMVFVGISPRLSQRGGTKQVQVAVPLLAKDLPQLKSLVELSRKAIDILSEKGLITPQGVAS